MRYVHDNGTVIDVKSPIRGAKWRPLDVEATPVTTEKEAKPAKKPAKKKN